MSHLKRHTAWLLAMGLCLSEAVQASEQLAANFGCINCHGANRRGEAPGFDRLAQKMAKYKGDDAALVDKVSRYRSGKAFEHVDAHERVSQETAMTMLRWLADGGK